MGGVVSALTLPTLHPPSPPTMLQLSCLKVHQLPWIALYKSLVTICMFQNDGSAHLHPQVYYIISQMSLSKERPVTAARIVTSFLKDRTDISLISIENHMYELTVTTLSADIHHGSYAILLHHTVQESHYPPGNYLLATFKNVLFPGHNHLLTTSTDDPTLWSSPEHCICWWSFTLIITLAGVRTIIKVLGHQDWWLAGGYDLEMGHFWKGLAKWLPGGRLPFCAVSHSATILYHRYHYMDESSSYRI